MRKQRIHRPWIWCTKVSETKHTIIYKSKFSKDVIAVDKSTGLATDLHSGEMGTEFTFKKKVFPYLQRSTAYYTSKNAHQLRLF